MYTYVQFISKPEENTIEVLGYYKMLDGGSQVQTQVLYKGTKYSFSFN